MKEFLNFIVEYRHELISFVIGVVVILVTIFRKKVKFVDFIKTVILQLIPTAINKAEEEFGHGFGHKKLTYTVKLISAYLLDEYGIDQSTVNKYVSFIEKNVEDILSTPQKKEV